MARLLEIYGEPVTLVNILDAKSAALKQDVPYATVIHGCMWYEEFARATTSSGTVVPSTLHKVQIPEAAKENYVPYGEWRKMDSRDGVFTLRDGDYLIKGAIEEPITSETLKTVVSDHEPDVFKVKAWRELTIVDEVPDGLSYAFSLEG